MPALKRRLTDLAAFGGAPAFASPLHVGQPNVGDQERLLARIRDAVERRWFTNDGPYLLEFERRVAETVGVAHCMAICNGTIALELAISAAGLTGEVILPSFTFIGTAHALQRQGITPVFCDIDPRTHNIDPARVEELITARTTGILGVHLWGRPCDVDRLAAIAARRELTLLFDAAHAFGCSYRGRMIGGFGAAEIFSFHATKWVHACEGGAVVTEDAVLADKVRLMRNFGFVDYDRVDSLGTNGKLNEIAAAMGLSSLESASEFVHANRRNYALYRAILGAIPGVTVTEYDETERCNFHYIVVEIDEAEALISRDQMQEILWADGVLARRYFYPGCHRMEPYRRSFEESGRALPHTERLASRVLCLPTGSAVSPDAIDSVGQIIRCAVEHGRHIRAKGVTRARPPAVVPTAPCLR